MPLSHLPVVLHVEDQMMLVMDVEDTLTGAGVGEVIQSSSVERALTLIAERDFSAAVVDAQVTDGSTQPVADALMAKGVPFVMLTGYLTGFGDAYEHLTWLSKPASEDQIVEALQAATRQDD